MEYFVYRNFTSENLFQGLDIQFSGYNDISEIVEDQRVKLLEELGDVQCMIELMVDHNIITYKELAVRSCHKREKLKKWSQLVDG